MTAWTVPGSKEKAKKKKGPRMDRRAEGEYDKKGRKD